MDASYSLVGDPYSPDTALIAGDAITNVLRPTFSGFIHNLGVADLSPHHSDHIGVPIGQDLFSKMRVIDPVAGENRETDH
jgi:hypothetical protein